ncbi:MAG: ATP-binding SpoIIE family protein phosphatase [Actinomycetota bacterium]
MLTRTPEEQLRRVQLVTDAALAHLTLDRMLDELLNRISELLHADTAAILLMDEAKHEVVATRAKGIEEEVETGVRIPLGRGFAGSVAASAKPIVLDHVDHTSVVNPILIDRGLRAMLGVPLIVDGNVVGVMHVGSLHERHFDQDDVELLQLVADRIALAIRARLQESDRLVSQTLQTTLLPERIPTIRDMKIAARYAPARGGLVGGDWYDVFVTPSGALCVVVGDVVGRGLQAAIVMTRVRNALRALALVDREPSQTAEHLNDMLIHFDPNVMITMLFGRVDDQGVMTYANAGHMPPLILDSNGNAEYREEPSEPALGAIPGLAYRNRTLKLERGDTLILYTDGLVDRRGQSIDQGLENLRKAAAGGEWRSLEDLCARALDTQSIGTESEDDTAVLLLQLPALEPKSPLHIAIDARPSELGLLRRALRSWIANAGWDDMTSQDVLVAVCEAATNAIEHAYGPGRGKVNIDGSFEGDELNIVVSDQGSWREPRGQERGRGQSIMKALMDEVSTNTSNSGTTVAMHKKVRS